MEPAPSDSRSLAHRTTDVRGMLDALRVRRERTDRDRMLAHRVYVMFERIHRAHDAVDLHFYVHEGTVTVYGDVLTHEQRDGVLGHLEALPGIQDVDDHLRVADRRPRKPFRIRPLAFDAE